MEGLWQAPHSRLDSQADGLPVSKSPWHLAGGWLARSTQQVRGICCMGQGAWGIPVSKPFATPNPPLPPLKSTCLHWHQDCAAHLERASRAETPKLHC